MTLIPAIDILGGACVRLTRGDYRRVERYGENPVEVARRFEAAGARWLHLVDLDAARASAAPDTRGRSAVPGHNRGIIRRITRTVSCRIEAGGGIRSLEDVKELLKAGVERLVLGTVVVSNPEAVRRWCAQYPGVLWAGIDADRGSVKISGWAASTELQDVELAGQAGKMGLAGIVYTSIGRDGTLEGPDIGATNRIAEVSGLPVILSGGIGSMEHLHRVAEQHHPRVEGVIIGKAIYRERVDLEALLRRGG